MLDSLVSVIIPVYNEERFLVDCVESVANQKYNNLQIIIVDDGSKKVVSTKCDEFANKDGRIEVIHKKNEGLSSARITGYQQAIGKWIMFVDDDDVLPNNAVEYLVQGVDDGVDIVSGKRMDLINVADYKEEKKNKYEVDICSGVDVCERLGKDNQDRIITPLWGKIYRKSFLDTIDLIKYKEICPTIYFEDVLMTPILFSSAKKISLINEVVYLHREVKTSISRSGKLNNFYYEQIESGNILLTYCKEKRLKKLYAYELKIYFGAILRLWCLLDKQSLDYNLIRKYKKSIYKYYKIYIKDYILYGDDKFFWKVAFFLFGIFKNTWGKLAYVVYFKKRGDQL